MKQSDFAVFPGVNSLNVKGHEHYDREPQNEHVRDPPALLLAHLALEQVDHGLHVAHLMREKLDHGLVATHLAEPVHYLEQVGHVLSHLLLTIHTQEGLEVSEDGRHDLVEHGVKHDRLLLVFLHLKWFQEYVCLQC